VLKFKKGRNIEELLGRVIVGGRKTKSWLVPAALFAAVTYVGRGRAAITYDGLQAHATDELNPVRVGYEVPKDVLVNAPPNAALVFGLVGEHSVLAALVPVVLNIETIDVPAIGQPKVKSHHLRHVTLHG
jgi:hypothetical protein